VRESTGLGYATTIHSAQGVSADTMHGLFTYAGSRGSWYRVADRYVLLERPPRVASHPPMAIPQLVATAPNQIWS